MIGVIAPDGARSASDARTLAFDQLKLYALDLRRALEAERKRSEELALAYQDTVMRLMEAILARNLETGRHLLRVKRYAEIVCTQLGWSAERIRLTGSASMLHDIGKIAMPDTILSKPGPLNAKEVRLVRRHAELGARILEGSPSPVLAVARTIALSHHECWNGDGYPRGLRAEAIPVEARVVMLADRYDALRSFRSYKPSYSHRETRDILLEGDGRTLPAHFDPEILNLFSRIHHEFAGVWRSLADQPVGRLQTLPEEMPWG